jgi:hypothetical protein
VDRIGETYRSGSIIARDIRQRCLERIASRLNRQQRVQKESKDFDAAHEVVRLSDFSGKVAVTVSY